MNERKGSLGRVVLILLLGGGTAALCLLLPKPNGSPVSYTHLTLPTIYSV